MEKCCFNFEWVKSNDFIVCLQHDSIQHRWYYFMFSSSHFPFLSILPAHKTSRLRYFLVPWFLSCRDILLQQKKKNKEDEERSPLVIYLSVLWVWWEYENNSDDDIDSQLLYIVVVVAFWIKHNFINSESLMGRIKFY